MQAKLNSELLNNLGNFINRVLSFIAKPSGLLIFGFCKNVFFSIYFDESFACGLSYPKLSMGWANQNQVMKFIPLVLVHYFCRFMGLIVENVDSIVLFLL